MAVQSATLASVVDGVKRDYGRVTQEFEETFPERLQEWFFELSSEFDFWFMQIKPGFLIAPKLFPFANPLAPAPTLLSPDGWFDVGWFQMTQGQEVYFFDIPDDLGDPVNSTWRRIDVAKIEYVQNVDPYGNETTTNRIQVVDHEEFFQRQDLSQQGQPRWGMLDRINGQAFLRVTPIPDNQAATYMFKTSFQVRDFPVLEDPSQSNLLLQNYPQVARAYGCLYAAMFFQDGDGIELWKQRLYGAPETTHGGRADGLLDRMKRDTRRMGQTRSDGIRTYTIPPQNMGRRGMHGPGYNGSDAYRGY